MIAGEAAFAALALRDYQVCTTPDAVHQTGEEADMGGGGGAGGKGGGHRAWTREEERGRELIPPEGRTSIQFVDCLVLDFEEVRIRIDDLALFLVSALLLLLTTANGRLRQMADCLTHDSSRSFCFCRQRLEG